MIIKGFLQSQVLKISPYRILIIYLKQLMKYFKKKYNYNLYSSFSILHILIEVLYGILAFKDNPWGEALIIALIILKFFNIFFQL